MKCVDSSGRELNEKFSRLLIPTILEVMKDEGFEKAISYYLGINVGIVKHDNIELNEEWLETLDDLSKLNELDEDKLKEAIISRALYARLSRAIENAYRN